MGKRGPQPAAEAPRENIMHVRLTDEERATIDAAAGAHSQPPSAWVRLVALVAADRAVKVRRSKNT